MFLCFPLLQTLQPNGVNSLYSMYLKPNPYQDTDNDREKVANQLIVKFYTSHMTKAKQKTLFTSEQFILS